MKRDIMRAATLSIGFSLLVYGTSIVTGCGKQQSKQHPPLKLNKPWTVVCAADRYSITDENGKLFALLDWSDYESAANVLRQVKFSHENSRPLTDAERAEMEKIRLRDWHECHPPASPTPPVDSKASPTPITATFKLNQQFTDSTALITGTLSADYKTISVGAFSERVTFNGGVAGEWLIVERHNKNAHDAKGFDPSYCEVTSNFRPIVKKRSDGKFSIQFKSDLPVVSK